MFQGCLENERFVKISKYYLVFSEQIIIALIVYIFPVIQVVRLEKANRRLQLELKSTNEQQEVQNRQV